MAARRAPGSGRPPSRAGQPGPGSCATGTATGRFSGVNVAPARWRLHDTFRHVSWNGQVGKSAGRGGGGRYRRGRAAVPVGPGNRRGPGPGSLGAGRMRPSRVTTIGGLVSSDGSGRCTIRAGGAGGTTRLVAWVR